jgi:hypothetical protein
MPNGENVKFEPFMHFSGSGDGKTASHYATMTKMRWKT